MSNKNNDFYQRLRNKIKSWLQSEEGKNYKWGRYLLFAPDLFHLLTKLAMDPEVPTTEKAKLTMAIAYFISPVDLIPEIIVGPIGYIDDIALASYVLNNLLNKIDPEILKRHWAGEDDVLQVIKQITAIADKMIGSGLLKKLTNFLK